MLSPNAIVAHSAMARHTGSGQAFRPAQASRRCPARARRTLTACGCAERTTHGDLAAGYTTTKTRCFLRVNRLQGSAYTPLHLDLHEMARKGVLTGEAVGAAEIDGVDDGNGSQVDESAPSPAS
jgi:hypothetical protein